MKKKDWLDYPIIIRDEVFRSYALLARMKQFILGKISYDERKRRIKKDNN